MRRAWVRLLVIACRGPERTSKGDYRSTKPRMFDRAENAEELEAVSRERKRFFLSVRHGSCARKLLFLRALHIAPLSAYFKFDAASLIMMRRPAQKSAWLVAILKPALTPFLDQAPTAGNVCDCVVQLCGGSLVEKLVQKSLDCLDFDLHVRILAS